MLDAIRPEGGLGYTTMAFVFLDKISTMDLHLNGDPKRTIDAARLVDLLEPSNMGHHDQILLLIGHGAEDPSDGIHGDEEYLCVVKLPTRNLLEELAEWTVKVGRHSAFPMERPTNKAFERASWQFHRSPETVLWELVTELA